MITARSDRVSRFRLLLYTAELLSLRIETSLHGPIAVAMTPPLGEADRKQFARDMRWLAGRIEELHVESRKIGEDPERISTFVANAQQRSLYQLADKFKDYAPHDKAPAALVTVGLLGCVSIAASLRDLDLDSSESHLQLMESSLVDAALLVPEIMASLFEVLTDVAWLKELMDLRKPKTRPLATVDLPSPETIAALSRAGLRALLASPEVVQALAGAGLLQGATSLPLREQRALIEALRPAVTGLPPNRPPNLRFDADLLSSLDPEHAEALTTIINALNQRGEIYSDLEIEIPDSAVQDLRLTWTAMSAHTGLKLTTLSVFVEAHTVQTSHYEPPEPCCLLLSERSARRSLRSRVEVKDMILAAALLCRTMLGEAGLAISEVDCKPGTFAQLVKQSLQDTIRPEPEPAPEPAPGPTSVIIDDPEDDDSEGESKPGKVTIRFG